MESTTSVGVHHIHLVVPEPELAKARELYLKVLGWPEATNRPPWQRNPSGFDLQTSICTSVLEGRPEATG
jgi:hypothetical protein